MLSTGRAAHVRGDLSHLAFDSLRRECMKNRMATIGSMLRQTVFDWIDDKAPQLGAALAFYTALSIAPLLVISLGIAALVFGQEAARGGVQEQMQFLVGDQGAKAVEEMIANANDTGKGVVATGLSLVIL